MVFLKRTVGKVMSSELSFCIIKYYEESIIARCSLRYRSLDETVHNVEFVNAQCYLKELVILLHAKRQGEDDLAMSIDN